MTFVEKQGDVIPSMHMVMYWWYYYPEWARPELFEQPAERAASLARRMKFRRCAHRHCFVPASHSQRAPEAQSSAILSLHVTLDLSD